MPEAHRQHATWTPGRLLEWAGGVGSETHDYVLHILNSRPHPEQKSMRKMQTTLTEGEQ
ncbi:hypothetical protein [Salmonella enterica]|uniref:hypothetical protein n=1 Tax=Salmonella enterica TaxID=28901 RepID=UPI003F750049